MSKNNAPIYEPGELDKVRKNLGEIDPAESQRIADMLGGQVGREKYIPDNAPTQKTPVNRNRQYIPTQAPTRDEIKKQIAEQQKAEKLASSKKKAIPFLAPKEKKAYYQLLTSTLYNISQRPGFLKILLSFGKVSPDDLSPFFITTSIPSHINHIDSFLESMRHLIDSTTGDYKQKITTEDDPYFITLRYIYDWNTRQLSEEAAKLSNMTNQTVEDAIPFTKELFKHLLKFYFLGESKMTETIKKLYNAATKPNSTTKEKNLMHAKKATGEWGYIFERVVQGLYPLIMRMTSPTCQPYPDFYTQNISKVLPFLEITKFDLVLPKKENKPIPEQSQEQQKEVEVTIPSEKVDKKDIPKDVYQSLGVLNTLFPNAGWIDLEKKPDMYTYFQPLYQFNDGFNLLSPSNPLQTTIVLLRIIEDFFQGCRNIAYNFEQGNDAHSEYLLDDDSLQKIIADWAQYREYVFNKILCSELRDYANRVYAQNDYKKTKYAKKQLSGWLWQVRTYFHPHLMFDIVFLERPAQDSTYKPFPARVKETTKIFTALVKNAGDGEPVANFNTPYRFDVENPIAYRLNILLGGTKPDQKTNLSLLKFTLHALRVLDWWINDENSLAYKEQIVIPYRSESEDGEPSFSAPLRKNQTELFLHYAKKRRAIQNQQQAVEKKQEDDKKN